MIAETAVCLLYYSYKIAYVFSDECIFQMDDILTIIQSSSWYLLPIRQQRCIMLMLCRAQNPTILRAGTLPLNLNTFVGVYFQMFRLNMFFILRYVLGYEKCLLIFDDIERIHRLSDMFRNRHLQLIGYRHIVHDSD